LSVAVVAQEFKRLRRKTQALVATVRERENIRTTRQQLPDKVSKLVVHLAQRRDRQTLALTFRGWANAMAAQRQIRAVSVALLGLPTMNLPCLRPARAPAQNQSLPVHEEDEPHGVVSSVAH